MQGRERAREREVHCSENVNKIEKVFAFHLDKLQLIYLLAKNIAALCVCACVCVCDGQK